MGEHKDWLRYSKDELKAAKILLNSSEGSVILPALYMAQQCAEKVLKAFLLFKGISPSRTHDLRDLVKKCTQHDKEFSSLESNAYLLNPYHLGTRYPDTFLPIPAFSIIEDSIKSAEIILEFVREKTLRN